MVDMKGYGSWAQETRSYEQLKFVDGINDLRSHELRIAVDLNNFGS